MKNFTLAINHGKLEEMFINGQLHMPYDDTCNTQFRQCECSAVADSRESSTNVCHFEKSWQIFQLSVAIFHHAAFIWP